MSWQAKRYEQMKRRKARYTRVHRKGMNRHHFFLAKCKGGEMTTQNLLWMHIERHEHWHKVFGNMGAEEVLALLERVVRAKRRQVA